MFAYPASNPEQKKLDENRFPTDGLKSILKNSELLEVLLKPLSNSKEIDCQNIPEEKTQLDVSFVEEVNTKNLFDWDIDENLTETKIYKPISDVDETKCYGNAFLGQNLWDKNDLFQTEKFGVKFESLEIDEFLNENGLNETDVEFLDHIQKFENLNSSSLTETIDSNLNCQKKSLTGSRSSLSDESTCNNIQKNDQNYAISNKRGVNTACLLDSKISSPQKKNLNRNQINFQQNSPFKNEEDEDDQLKLFDSFQGSCDWNINENTIDSISDYEFDSKSKKLCNQDLKQQPMMRKSKKQFVPNELKDEKYWARRRKNNIAAKRSRDARRMKENQIVLRATYLEKENDNLRKQLEDFKRETKLLKAKLSVYEKNNQNEEC